MGLEFQAAGVIWEEWVHVRISMPHFFLVSFSDISIQSWLKPTLLTPCMSGFAAKLNVTEQKYMYDHT